MQGEAHYDDAHLPLCVPGAARRGEIGGARAAAPVYPAARYAQGGGGVSETGRGRRGDGRGRQGCTGQGAAGRGGTKKAGAGYTCVGYLPGDGDGGERETAAGRV